MQAEEKIESFGAMRLQVHTGVFIYREIEKAKRTPPSANTEIDGVGSFTVFRDRDKQIILYKFVVNYDFKVLGKSCISTWSKWPDYTAYTAQYVVRLGKKESFYVGVF